jgi:NTP pyrophosphatase (non-canonical NTP hydrolase)
MSENITPFDPTENFDAYQIWARRLATYPGVDKLLLWYPAVKLAGEAGEVSDKVGKLWRDHRFAYGTELTLEQRLELLKELGDVLWYVADLANSLNTSLSTVARLNIEKLESRKTRGVLGGSGDNR